MNFVMYPLFAIFVLVNMFYAIDESISVWHLVWVAIVAGLSVFCIKQTVKCWDLQLPPEASEYYIDILALNTLVAIGDPFTHKVWYFYFNTGICIGLFLPLYWSNLGNSYGVISHQNIKYRTKKKIKRSKRSRKNRKLNMLKLDICLTYLHLTETMSNSYLIRPCYFLAVSA